MPNTFIGILRQKYTRIALPVMLCFSCAGEQPAEIRSMPADPVVGDWQGTLDLASAGQESLAVQVIGYESGTYRANVGAGFDTREPYLVILQGQTEDASIVFEGEAKKTFWRGKLKEGQFSGTVGGARTGTFRLKKIERKSPTLGLEPPEGALVLFDGSSLDKWSHPEDPTGYVNLSRFIGGDDRAAYLRTRIFSQEGGAAVIETGSDDGMKLWLNGKLVLAVFKERSAEPASDKTEVVFRQGWNDILVKVVNGGGGWGAYIKPVALRGGPRGRIFAEDPDSTGRFDPGFPEKTGYYITRWQVSGPYLKNGSKGKALFDHPFGPEIPGSDADSAAWRTIDPSRIDYTPRWQIEKGAMRVNPGSGNLVSREKFNDTTIHVEFRIPYMPAAWGQERGNSGVYIQGRYEIQVLDSYGLGGADNECGGIYKVSRPRVNMCAPPLQWQTYDIDFFAPRFAADGRKMSEARITVRHNGVLIHENLHLPEVTGGALDGDIGKPGPLMLQDHGDPVEYRNIWVVPEI